MNTALVAVAAVLVASGAAIQVAIGAGLSVVCGSFLLLWLGLGVGVPVLLCLNLLVSIIATAFGGMNVRWGDVLLASGATLVGCGVAALLPALPDSVLKGITACVLAVAALPRPGSAEHPPSERSARTGITLASLLTGALTVWTATPGPVTPVAMARGGRSGADIRRTMQPVSIIGYGAALIGGGPLRIDVVGPGIFASLVAATLLGTAAGFILRPGSTRRVWSC